MTNRERIERLRSELCMPTALDFMDSDIAALLALLDEWEKALRTAYRYSRGADEALALLDAESKP